MSGSSVEGKDFDQAVRAYILDNPEVIVEALETYERQQKVKAEEKRVDLIKAHKKDLLDSDLPFIGNPKGDVTVIEFFDYNCGYCKRALPDLIKQVKADKNLKVVFHEMPILGAPSRLAALWALAAHKQGKYLDYHTALMEHRGPKNEGTLLQIGERLGLDTARLKKDAGSKAVSTRLADSLSLARTLRINGTPAFIVGDQFFGGYIPHDALKSAIHKAR